MKPRKLLLVLMIVSVLTGCNIGKTKELSPMEKIQKRFMELDSYESTVYVSYISDQGKNEYKMKHYYKRTGEYRIEIIEPSKLSGITTIFNGEKVVQMNSNFNDQAVVEIEKSPYQYEILLGSFLKNYFQSQDVSIEVANMPNGETTVLETQVPGNNRLLEKERLWVDNKTLNPLAMIVYDQNKEKRIIVQYEEFMYNKTLDDKLFVIE
ncbi:MAG: outer membrane lipoprotein carrier protein LolA [Epulopiscium sp.]|nr:outer membrane lipoprotein carrier protein LolA [Candidatus Epulonipiscium sp.]